jgi:hypothetical protein
MTPKRKCYGCGELCAQQWCGRCERVLESPPAEGAVDPGDGSTGTPSTRAEDLQSRVHHLTQERDALRIALKAAADRLVTDEGDGIDGRLFRCRVCHKGWSVGGMWSKAVVARHDIRCPVGDLATLATGEDQ